MLDLFQAAVSPPSLFFTVLLGLVVFYWALYLLGALGEEALDFFGLDMSTDIDVDADVDADVDVDVDAEVGTGGPGILVSFLHFFHVGQVPVAIIFSILAVAMWFLSITANHLLGNTNLFVGLALFVPIFVGGLIITKTILTPFAPMLKRVLDTSGDTVQIVGKRCVVVSLKATPHSGQAEMQTDGAPILLNVKTREGVTLDKGDEAVVFDHDEENNVYLIAAFDVNRTIVGEK